MRVISSWTRVLAGLGLGAWLCLACGGGQRSGPAPQAISVTITPGGASLWVGGTQTFHATVTGSANQAVTWSVLEASGGSITSAGFYTAPSSPGEFHVKALSSADATQSAQVPVTVSVAPPGGACNGADLGIGANLRGFTAFPADSPWNQDITTAPVDPASGAMIAFMGASLGLHPDFGAGLYNGSPIGIPYAVVGAAQARVPVAYQAYGSESDPGPMPIPVPPPYEGADPSATSGDRHVLVMDRDTCLLYELYGAQRQPDGSWYADSGALWDLKSNNLRPFGWTSADAAGLPVFPGLVRYDEVAAGTIPHALRFTVPSSRRAYVLPATHWASSNTSPTAPPMGLRVRLKASVDISAYPAQARVVLTALKRYGMILADNGSPWFITGAPDARWDNDQLATLSGIKGADLEVLQMGTVHTADPTGTAPAITSFIATPSTLPSGAATTLSWNTTSATRWFVTPNIGWVTGTSLQVRPTATTSFTLQAQGPYGSTTRTLVVTVTP